MKTNKNKAGWDSVRKNHESTLAQQQKVPSIIERHVNALKNAIALNSKAQAPAIYDIYDDCGIYIQRTLQFLWLIVKLDLLSNQEL